MTVGNVWRVNECKIASSCGWFYGSRGKDLVSHDQASSEASHQQFLGVSRKRLYELSRSVAPRYRVQTLSDVSPNRRREQEERRRATATNSCQQLTV